MSGAEQRCVELVWAVREQQRSIAAVLCAAELWAARVDTLPPVTAKYADRLVGVFAEFRAASTRWWDTMHWVLTQRWCGAVDLRAATELDDAFSGICADSRVSGNFDGTLCEGVVLQHDLRLQQESLESGLYAVNRCVAAADADVEPNVTLGLQLMLLAVMKASRAVGEAYRDLTRCLHEPCLGVSLSATEPTPEVAAEAGSYTIARWMRALEQGGLTACEQDEVLRERERAYAAAGYELGAEAGRIRLASIMAFRARTGTYSPVRDPRSSFGWSAA